MSKLRRAAKGRPCMVRLPGCDGGGETTVLAHLRIAGYCGMGLKPDDLAFGAWCCAPCHDLVDGRNKLKGYGRLEIQHAHALAVCRTVDELRKEGLL